MFEALGSEFDCWLAREKESQRLGKLCIGGVDHGLLSSFGDLRMLEL
jgi:hypothetical protein